MAIARLSSYASRMADLLNMTTHKTTKQTILVMLYVSFIWDLARKHYVDSRTRDYEKHYSKSSKTLQNHQEHQGYQSFSRCSQDILCDYSRTISNLRLIDKTISDKSVKSELDILVDRGFDCPIPSVPKLLRIYRIFSTAFFIYATIKYACLCTIYYGWLDIDKVYGCFLPGRVAFLPDRGLAKELPWVALLIYPYHLVWRALWHFVDGIDVDCLLFLCYDRDAVLSRHYELSELNDSYRTQPDVAYRKYLCNKIFYRRHANAEGYAFYTMKQHRSLEHYDKMQELLLRLRLFYINTIYVVLILMAIGSYYTYLDHDYFDLSYPMCRSFSNSPHNDTFRWSFSDKFRLYYLLADYLEGTIFIIDTGLITSITFAAGILLTHDLCLRFDMLRRRTCNLNEKFRSCTSMNDLTIPVSPSWIAYSNMKSIEYLQEESDWIFNETIGIFQLVGQVDDFMRRFSTYVVFGWLLNYSSYQATSILSLLPKGGLVRYFNQIAMGSCSLIFITAYLIFARPYHGSRLLYRELCSAMALSPNIPEKKIAWRWLLEHYRDTNIYSLHLIGKSFTLSNLNILRCVSWFVTCSVVLLSLLRY